jgi:hypothetical protein
MAAVVVAMTFVVAVVADDDLVQISIDTYVLGEHLLLLHDSAKGSRL